MDKLPPGVALVSGPSPLCGSLRAHGEHDWRGQTTGADLHCPGVPADRAPDHPPQWLIEGNAPRANS